MSGGKTEEVSRRRFVKGTAAAGAFGVTSFSFIPAGALGQDGQTPPSERIGIGLIGCGGMGQGNLANCARQPDVQVTALCDAWGSRLEAAGRKYAGAKKYPEHDELLQDKDVDGVIVATPPHWHCRLAVDACEAGKDLYLQKPMTLHLGESLAVRNAVNRHKRMCQIGTQIHAAENYRRVIEWIRSGKLGNISVARTFNVMNQGPAGIGHDPNTTPPADLDWNRWLGPYPERPYNSLLARSSFHHCFFMEYTGGWTCGMAPHIIDLPIWALELGFPEVVYSSGGRYTVDDDSDGPDTQEVLWQYPGFTMTWWMSTVNSFAFDFGRGKPARRLGIYFHGLRGTLFANYGMHEIVPEGNLLEDSEPPEKSMDPSPGHEREWLDSIKSRQAPSCNPNYHCKVDVPLVLANLSLKLKRSVRFDPQTEKIVGDEEAARLSVPEYRDPWKFPSDYL
jgi:predicted dehydrogenase